LDGTGRATLASPATLPGGQVVEGQFIGPWPWHAYVLPRTQTKSALSEQLRPRRVPQSTKSQLQVLC